MGNSMVYPRPATILPPDWRDHQRQQEREESFARV
jgi:hypothetical protein